MKRLISILVAVVVAAFLAAPTILAEGTETSVTGAAAGVFPGGTTLYAVSLSTLKLGNGLTIATDATAVGQFEAELEGYSPLGLPQTITVEGEVSSGSLDAFGNPTFQGLATVDLGDGSVPLSDVPFLGTFTQVSEGVWDLALTVAGTALPAAGITEGSITVQSVVW
jgi:hypothetical protein